MQIYALYTCLRQKLFKRIVNDGKKGSDMKIKKPSKMT